MLATSVAEHLALKLFTDHLQGNQTPHWKHGLQSVRSGIKTMKTPFSEKSAVLSPVFPKDIQIPVLTGICQLYGTPKG